MIKLEVEDYCQNCPKFEAEVENPANIYNAFGDDDYIGDTIIRCEHRKQCQKVFEYAKKHLINGE